MTELEKGKLQAKRKIKALDFSGSNAAIALVSQDQGGPANGVETLMIKAANFSDEFISKASTVKVELEITEFLQRFYHIYDVEAEILARTLGFKTRRQEKYELEQKEKQIEDQEQKIDPEYPSWDADEQEYEDYIKSKISSIDIMKSLQETDSIIEILSGLSEDQYLQLLQDQEMLEKAFKKMDEEKVKEAKKKPKTKTTRSYSDPNSVVAKASATESPEVDNSIKADVNTSTVQHEVKEGKGTSPVVKTKIKEKLMTTDVKIVEELVEKEMVEKSVFEAIQKQAQEQSEILKAALAELELFKAEKQALIEKSRKEKLLVAVKDEGRTEVFFKSLKDAEDEQFEAVVKALGEMASIVEKSNLFQEQGASVQVEEPAKSHPLETLIKSKYAK